MQNEICIDLDAVRFYYMDLEQMDCEIKKMKAMGLSAINIMCDIFLDEQLKDFSNNLLKVIGNNKVKVVLYSTDRFGMELDCVYNEEVEEVAKKHISFLRDIHKKILDNDINSDVKVIYKSGRCMDGNTIEAIDRVSKFYKIVADEVKNIDIEILVELIAVKPMMGRMIGDCWDDIESMCCQIDAVNWGICWNTGNSRMNHVQYADSLIPPESVVEKVKLANVHNHINVNNKLAIYKSEIQDQEIKYLLSNGYEGMFNLEYVYAYLNDNNVDYEEVYDSIEFLGDVLKYFLYLKKENLLKVSTNIAKMNRQSIRRVFDENVTVIFEDGKLEFNSIELATHSLKVWNQTSLNLIEGKEYIAKVSIKAVGKVDVKVKLLMKREEQEGIGYIFKIMDKNKDIKKKINKIVYSVK